MVFVVPGPVLAMTTPSSPVARAYPSAVGRVSSGLLVPYADRRDGPAPHDGVVDRQVVDADNAEHMAYAEGLEGADDRLSSCHLH
jgi:hypothetical protein